IMNKTAGSGVPTGVRNRQRFAVRCKGQAAGHGFIAPFRESFLRCRVPQVDVMGGGGQNASVGRIVHTQVAAELDVIYQKCRRLTAVEFVRCDLRSEKDARLTAPGQRSPIRRKRDRSRTVAAKLPAKDLIRAGLQLPQANGAVLRRGRQGGSVGSE